MGNYIQNIPYEPDIIKAIQVNIQTDAMINVSLFFHCLSCWQDHADLVAVDRSDLYRIN